MTDSDSKLFNLETVHSKYIVLKSLELQMYFNFCLYTACPDFVVFEKFTGAY